MNNYLMEMAHIPTCAMGFTAQHGGTWASPIKSSENMIASSDMINKALSNCASTILPHFNNAVEGTHLRMIFRGKFIGLNSGAKLGSIGSGSVNSLFGIFSYDGNAMFRTANAVGSYLTIKASDCGFTTFIGQQLEIVIDHYCGGTNNLTSLSINGHTITKPAVNWMTTIVNVSGAFTSVSNLFPNGGIVNDYRWLDMTGDPITIYEAPQITFPFPQPQQLPRIMADEPMRWTAAKPWFDNAPTAKMIFDLEFEQLAIPVEGATSLFSTAGNAPFACDWIISSATQFTFRVNYAGLYDTAETDTPYLQIILNEATVLGKHTVHAEAVDGKFTVTLDGISVSSTSVGSRITGTYTGYHLANANAAIRALRIATAGYKPFIWPSPAEATKLLMIDNFAHEQDYWHPVDTASINKITTRFNLSSTRRPWTLITRAYVPSHASNGTTRTYRSVLLAQGDPTTAPNAYAFWVEESHSSTGVQRKLKASFNINGTTSFVESNLPIGKFDKWTTYTLKFSTSDNGCRTYVDGVWLKCKTSYRYAFSRTDAPAALGQYYNTIFTDDFKVAYSYAVEEELGVDRLPVFNKY